MGRQIEFFQTKEDEIGFLKFIMEAGYSILDDRGEGLSLDEAINSKALSLFIKFNNSYISTTKNGYINQIVSEVIQYSIGLKKDNQLQSSRLWMESKFFDSSGQQNEKSKDFNDMYDSLTKWIKKHYVKSDCKNYYIGNEAYTLHKEKGFDMIAGPKHFVTFS